MEISNQAKSECIFDIQHPQLSKSFKAEFFSWDTDLFCTPSVATGIVTGSMSFTRLVWQYLEGDLTKNCEKTKAFWG